MDMQEPKGVEIHIRRFPRPIWLRLRHAALAEGKSFRQYVLEILEAASHAKQECKPEIFLAVENEDQAINRIRG